ncbi:MAG: MerR family transcriptional regulator [Novosphingobium sp.]|nr:MerR family transcriptional regulator [Novosphingobium sp.]MCP5379943.1 MerR family transcriptional regulator [Novosphingobium sp.]MCP5389044.1 MerR family transcriptional regulator [Novosphingobium sp.]
MKMRDLEAKTGVNRETIRVYFRKGLLPEPARPARNVADYSDEHVRAINAVRKLQRESGLTLAQISKMLNGDSGGERLGASAFPHLEELVAARVGFERNLVSVKTMLSHSPKALDDARALDRIGLVELIENGKGPQLSVTDAGLVSLWGRMREHGFDENNGFPPEILGYYVEAANIVAGNEARMFLERIEGRIDTEQAADMLEFALPTMLDFFGLIRLKTFLANIGQSTAGSRLADPDPSFSQDS